MAVIGPTYRWPLSCGASPREPLRAFRQGLKDTTYVIRNRVHAVKPSVRKALPSTMAAMNKSLVIVIYGHIFDSGYKKEGRCQADKGCKKD